MGIKDNTATCNVCGREQALTAPSRYLQEKELTRNGWVLRHDVAPGKVNARLVVLCPACGGGQHVAIEDIPPGGTEAVLVGSGAQATPQERPQWELVSDHEYGETHRMRVPSGWLVREVLRHTDENGNEQHAVAVAFVYDFSHEWTLPE